MPALSTTEDIQLSPLGSGRYKGESGFAFNIATGYAFHHFRLEGELAYQLDNHNVSASVSIPPVSATGHGDVKTHILTGFINGYYDFKNYSRFTPYVSVGIGAGGVIDATGIININTNIPPVNIKDLGLESIKFAYQVGAGVDYSLTDQITVGVKYRYTELIDSLRNLLNIKTPNAFAAHNIYAGVRFHF